MSASRNFLVAGRGWQARDVICRASPGDRPFEERHGMVCVALVTAGTFRYRTAQGQALMAPGSLLLGNAGTCYECGHDHSAGDRCLSFHFDGAFLDRLLDGVAGVRRDRFGGAHVPPLAQTARLAAEAEAAREERDAEALGEVAIRIAGAAFAADAGERAGRAPTSGEERRVARVIRLIEREADRELGLDDLAAEACLSPYHFLRVFRATTGMTPYQYVLRTRLHRAAVRLRGSDEQVSTIALEAGFNDLSTFNRRFRQQIGATPLAWRRFGRAAPRAARR